MSDQPLYVTLKMLSTLEGFSVPKQRLDDLRNDFRGGRNSVVSGELLNPNELVDTTNARIDAKLGAFTKRSGTRRMNATAIGAPSQATGVIQWDSTGTKQIVAIGSDGKLYH